jgi:hypothetical protein
VPKHEAPLTGALETFVLAMDRESQVTNDAARSDGGRRDRPARRLFRHMGDAAADHLDGEGYTRMNAERVKSVTVCREPKRDMFMDFCLEARRNRLRKLFIRQNDTSTTFLSPSRSSNRFAWRVTLVR